VNVLDVTALRLGEPVSEKRSFVAGVLASPRALSGADEFRRSPIGVHSMSLHIAIVVAQEILFEINATTAAGSYARRGQH
jgi:hypothetical protein